MVVLGICVLQAQREPDLRCLQVEENESLTLTWVLPANTTGLQRFDIYYSQDNVSFSLAGTATSTATTFNHAAADAVTRPLLHYYVEAVFSSGSPGRSDTLKTIEFYLTNTGNGLAQLNWFSPVEPLLSSYDSKYEIKKRSFATPGFITAGNVSTPNTSFKDTIYICSGTVEYNVILADTEVGCANVSRIQGEIFSNKIDPLPPNLDSVSIDYHTNQIMLGWKPSASGDVTAYIIYYFVGGTEGWKPVDTVYGYDTTFWIDNERSASEVTEYRIASLDSCMNSSYMSEPQQTMIISPHYDICRETITLNWTAYQNMTGGLTGYRIYYSIDGAPLQYAGETDAATTTFSISNLLPESTYKLVVKAVGNGEEITASSLSYEFRSGDVQIQHLVYMRSVSVLDNQDIELTMWTSGDTLPFTELQLFRFDEAAGHFALLGSMAYDGGGSYTFLDKNVAVSSHIYRYKAELRNECDMPAGESNIGRNILLSGTNGEERKIHLQWTDYGEWSGGVREYAVERRVETNSFFEEIGIVYPGSSLTFSDDVDHFYHSGSNFTYRIVAKEHPNEYGFSGESISNEATVSQDPLTFIPNAFSPEGKNQQWQPVNSFVSLENYSLLVYSRAGQIIFQTKDPYMAWDGKVNGVTVPGGVYFYYITYSNPNGTTFEKSGSVTVIR